MFQIHKDSFGAAMLLLVTLLLFQAGYTLNTNSETCYSRQHRGTTVNVRVALNNKKTTMEATKKEVEKDCILACCSTELKPGQKCNMVVYKPFSQSVIENCYLFYCETEQDCPLMPAKAGINTYDIFKGMTHPAAKERDRKPSTPVANSILSTQFDTTTKKPITTTTSTPQPTTQCNTWIPTTSSTTSSTTSIPTPKTTNSSSTTPTTTASTKPDIILLTMPAVTMLITTVSPTTSPTTTTTSTTTTTTTTTTSTSTKVPFSVSSLTTRPPELHLPAISVRPPKKPNKPSRRPDSHGKSSTQKQITHKMNTHTTTLLTTTTTTTTTTPITTTTTTSTTTKSIKMATTTTSSSTATTERTTLVVVKMKNHLKDEDSGTNSLIHPPATTMDNSKVPQTIWKNSLIILVLLTVIILMLILVIVGRKAMESFDRRHYTRLELNDLHYEI